MNGCTYHQFQPQLECLEDRCLLAGGIRAALTGRTLNVAGTPQSDVIDVRMDGDRIAIQGVRIKSDLGRVASIPVRDIDKIKVVGGAGDDVITFNTDAAKGNLRRFTFVANGGAGDDVLTGGAGNDVLRGNDGDDLLLGGAGDDRLLGGGGNDRLEGGVGNDLLDGGTGSDQLLGGDGNDVLFGGEGYDVLRGEGGDDVLDAGAAGEDVDGGEGWDLDTFVWAQGGTRPEDVVQMSAPTCSLLATLAAITRDVDLSDFITYLGNFRYSVRLYRQNVGWVEQKVAFDGATTTYDPDQIAEGKYWTVLMQRAWVRERKAIGKGASAWPDETFVALTGDKARAYRATEREELRRALDAGQWIVAGTPWKGWRSDKLLAGHAYTVLAMEHDGDVTVRNPWGIDGGQSPSGNANDGIIQLAWTEFSRSMDWFWVL